MDLLDTRTRHLLVITSVQDFTVKLCTFVKKKLHPSSQHSYMPIEAQQNGKELIVGHSQTAAGLHQTAQAYNIQR